MRKYYLVFFLLFIIDRLSKVYFLKKLSLGNFFSLHLNQNIAFSLELPFYILYPLLFILFSMVVIKRGRHLRGCLRRGEIEKVKYIAALILNL